MADFQTFITEKIKKLEEEVDNVTKEIERKSGSLIAKRQVFQDEADQLKKLLKEYQKTTKAK